MGTIQQFRLCELIMTAAYERYLGALFVSPVL